MSVDEEELKAGFGEGLFDADAMEGWGCWGAVRVGDGVAPGTGGAVAALRCPDAAGSFAEVADVGVDRGVDLGANALVGAEERHVAVGGSAGDDVDEAGVVEVTEGRDEIAVEAVEVVEGL